MLRTLTFDEFWDEAVAAVQGCNGYCYHPCCDVWTSRSARVKRDSHLKHIQWRKLFTALGKTMEQKKQHLLEKMNEEGWQIPIVLNDSCKVQLNQVPEQKAAIEPRLPYIQPQDLQVGFSHPNFTHPDPMWSEQNTPASTLYFT